MKQIKTAGNDIIVIEISKDACNFTFHDNDGITYDSESLDTKENPWQFIDLPKQTYGFYKKLSELSEEECSRFVESKYGETCISKNPITTYKDYTGIVSKYYPYEISAELSRSHRDALWRDWGCKTTAYWHSLAKESLISLLQSNGIDTNKELLIIEVL